ncbi:MAG: penicillin-binding protein 2 [Candidatus Uhrbacteria bacterium]
MLFKNKKTSNSHNPFGITTEDGFSLHLSRSEDQSTITDLYQGELSENPRLRPLINLSVIKVTLIVVCFILGLVLARAGYLQIIRGDYYYALAEGNRIRIENIPAIRGVVYDRNLNLLVENVPSFTITITADDLPDDTEERDQVLNVTAEIINIPRGEIEAILAEYKDVYYQAVPIARNVSHEKTMAIASQNQLLPGVDYLLTTERAYATDAARSLSHILGFMGKLDPDEIDLRLQQGYARTDEIGKQGIEKTYEELLRGQVGEKIVEVDALGNEIVIINEEQPVEGQNIIMAIDSELQSFIEMRLSEYQDKNKNIKASVIALDPNNGQVLSLVSLPSFDSNDFVGGINSSIYHSLISDPDQPLFPRAIAGEYPSGSTFKPVVAVAALSEGLINEYTSFLSSGGLAISTWFFPDWKAGGHGLTNVRKALAESVNTFFYIIGGGYEDFIGLGVDRIVEYAGYFGLGSVSGIDIAGEALGFLPSKEWKEKFKNERWYVGDTYHLAIGQGDILVTPLQIAVMTSVFANGGMLYQPHLLYDVEQSGKDVREDVTADAIRIVREGLRQGVTEGSSRYLLTVTEPVAGKTGTAQPGGDKDYHAWFTGFGPYENPEIVLTILIEEGGEGSEVAVPIARDIFNWWFANR